jgi:inositol transport system ATP-binding protein
MDSNKNILEFKNVTKVFPGVTALDNVSFTIGRGEIHALVGENGAGKSTLVNILAGVYHMTRGTILYNDLQIHFLSPSEALKNGISVIYQERNLVPKLSVIANVFLGDEDCRKFLNIIKRDRLKERFLSLLERVGFDIPAEEIVSNLSVSQQQMVEILKALSLNAELMIMDEPTSSLTDIETEHLFSVMKRLKDEGKTIIYISHFLDEVLNISDRVTVLRDGKYIGTKETKECSRELLIQMMVGRQIGDIFEYNPRQKREIFLSVRNLTVVGKFQGVSFDVKKGEVLGFAGLVGSGRTDVARVLFGLDEPEEGEIFIHERNIAFKNPGQAIKRGINLLPEDRKRKGLVLGLELQKNITLANLKEVCYRGVISDTKERKVAKQYIKALDIKTPSEKQLVRYLSGGNQQKVVIAKWLFTNFELLILDEPTTGIDVGAKMEIYRLVDQLAREGKAIIFISSEMMEILGVCDRVIVFSAGKITGEFSREAATEEKIMAAAFAGM